VSDNYVPGGKHPRQFDLKPFLVNLSRIKVALFVQQVAKFVQGTRDFRMEAAQALSNDQGLFITVWQPGCTLALVV
jgi:hypothetical protein